MTVADRLKELGITLPPPATPGGNYTPANLVGHTLYVAGQLPTQDGTLISPGKVGGDVTVEEAAEAARIATLNALSAVENALEGGLDAVESVTRITVFVNAVPDFDQHSIVANGASDLLVAVLGDAGRHARNAIGMGSLPRGSCVEVETNFKIR
ncbi:MAG: RidA family protein [Chloroflexi bacterium]|nr:RidA family protein [Chloroflexota bacterium]